MRRFILAAVLALAITGVATAGRYFAVITAVDADKDTVTYTITHGKERNNDVTAKLDALMSARMVQ